MRLPDALDRWLRMLDRVSAERIEPRNRRRVLRAIEVSLVSGRPFSHAGRRRSEPIPALWIGLRRERATLRERIQQRVTSMLKAGWLQEVRTLLFMGYAPNLPSMSAHGYPELARVVRGEWTMDEAVERIRFNTQAFVRRQETWLRSEPRVQGIDVERADAVDAVIAAWELFLHNRSQ
jgi:tRNA dimethylallyltransferase